MGCKGSYRRILATLVLALGVAACGDDDDDPTTPPPDAGVETMLLNVGDRVIRVDQSGSADGDVGPLPVGDIPISATFLAGNEQPHPDLPPGRYIFEVVFGDTLAFDWTPGNGFSGALSVLTAGTYTLTFRLRDTSNNGTEIFLTTLVDIDIGLRQARLIFGPDSIVVPAQDALPGTLDGVPVDAVPVRFEFLDAAGAPVPLVTEDRFTATVTSSDGNIVAWTQDGAFSGTLRGVSPGVATIAVRLLSAVNGARVFQHELTVIVGDG